jgi:hypothetical protein
MGLEDLDQLFPLDQPIDILIDTCEYISQLLTLLLCDFSQ